VLPVFGLLMAVNRPARKPEQPSQPVARTQPATPAASLPQVRIRPAGESATGAPTQEAPATASAPAPRTAAPAPRSRVAGERSVARQADGPVEEGAALARPATRRRVRTTPRSTSTEPRIARRVSPATTQRADTPTRRATRVTRRQPTEAPVVASGGAATLNSRAYQLQRQGRHREAEALLRQAVKRDPRHPYAQYNLGWSLVEQGKAREALDPLRRTASQQPGRWEPQERLAQAYRQLGDREKAAQAEARARALRSGRRARGSVRARVAGSRAVYRDQSDERPVRRRVRRAAAARPRPVEVQRVTEAPDEHYQGGQPVQEEHYRNGEPVTPPVGTPE